MPVKAKLSYLRIAPRKVRIIADLIRGKSVAEAQNILRFVVKRASLPLFKLIASAVANAKNNFKMEEDNLYVSKILVDEGPKLKRWLSRSRGRADELQKKTSHVTVILEETARKATEVKESTGEAVKTEKARKVEKTPKTDKVKLRPTEEMAKPKLAERGAKKVQRRTAF